MFCQREQFAAKSSPHTSVLAGFYYKLYLHGNRICSLFRSSSCLLPPNKTITLSRHSDPLTLGNVRHEDCRGWMPAYVLSTRDGTEPIYRLQEDISARGREGQRKPPAEMFNSQLAKGIPKSLTFFTCYGKILQY